MKHCPPDKILNPRTQRCIKRDGRVAKTLTVNKALNCPPDKIRNPRTKRCIKRDGRLAKTLKKRREYRSTSTSKRTPNMSDSAYYRDLYGFGESSRSSRSGGTPSRSRSRSRTRRSVQ